MGMLDDLQPTQICRDLRGRYVMLFGAAKVGKTSTAALWPNTLICEFEIGTNALPGVMALPMEDWGKFKRLLAELNEKKNRDRFSTIVIDTVSVAYGLCEKYVCAQNGVKSIGEIGYGKGWNMLKDEFESSLRKLTFMGYGVVLIAHSKTKATEFTDAEGNPIEAVAPDLPNAAYQICNRLVDLIGYIGQDYDNEGNSHRYIYTRATPSIFAGSRYKYLKPKIPLSYQNLVDAIAEAMEKAAEETSTGFISSDEYQSSLKAHREFNEVMDEAKQLWMDIKTKFGADEGAAKMNAVIEKIFGQPMKLSAATPDQQELVEYVIEEFKKML